MCTPTKEDEHHTVLWVDELGLPWRNAKETCVKEIDIGEIALGRDAVFMIHHIRVRTFGEHFFFGKLDDGFFAVAQ